VWENRVVSVNPVALVVAVDQVPSRRVVRAAVARIVSVVISHQWAAVAGPSAAAAETALAPAAVAAAIAWVAAGSVVADVAVADEVAAAAGVAAVEAGAGDE